MGFLRFFIILILLELDLKTLSYFKSTIISILEINQTLKITLRKTSILHFENPKSRTIPSKAGSTFFGVSFISVS